MLIALFPKVDQEESKRLAFQVIEFFLKKNIPIVVEDEKAEVLQVPPLSSINPNDITFLISMGGDGSILRIAHQYHQLNAAILGINLGHLGFMADVQISEIIPGLEDLINGNYTIQDRIMIEGNYENSPSFLAINDCVLHRARNPSLVKFTVHIDGVFLNTIEADGLILATPTGSTAYSLAAGGPILSPEIEAFVLTPICPHTISNRSLVLKSSHEITIEYISHYNPIEVVADGLHCFELKTGGSIQLKRSSKKFKLVNLTRINFFTILRDKLGLTGKLR